MKVEPSAALQGDTGRQTYENENRIRILNFGNKFDLLPKLSTLSFSKNAENATPGWSKYVIAGVHEACGMIAGNHFLAPVGRD